MVSTDIARNVVGIIGNGISFGLFLSPLPTFYRIIKQKAVEQFSAMPYLATLMNCMLWMLYGMPFVHPHSVLVLTINGCGTILQSIYITIFIIYSSRQLRLKVLVILVVEHVFLAVVVVVVLFTTHTYEKRSLIVGILCVIFGTLMYASPLSVMTMVIQTKSVKYMPFFLSLAAFLNGVCWTAYALIRLDIYITIPNGMGALLGLAQLILYFYYFRSTPVDDPSSQLQMSGGGDGNSHAIFVGR